MDHEVNMREALRLAALAAAEDEVPVGAVVVKDTLRLGEGYNRNIADHDPTAHAEVVALRDACGYAENYRLQAATMYVTLEPCLMCFMAMIHARIGTLVFGAPDPKTGFSLFLSETDLLRMNHQMTVISGVLEAEASEQIRTFFRDKRQRGKRKWLKSDQGVN